MAQETLIERTIKRIEFLPRSIGINIKTGERSHIDTLKCRFMYIATFLWLNTDVAGAIVWFYVGLSNGKSFTELTYDAPCITLSCLANTKSLTLVIFEKNIYKLIDNLRALDISEHHQSPQIKEIIREEHDFLNSVIKVFNGFYFVLWLAFTLNPLIIMTLKYFATNEVELVLPFLIIYPFDPFDIRYWPLVYARQIWSCAIVSIDICTADYLFYIFCTYIRIQFRILKYKIENLIPYDDGNEKVRNKQTIRKELVGLIKWHQQLIDSANALESIYTRSTLINFVSSSIVICLTGFNVVANSDVAIVVTFASFLCSSLLQIFFLCFFGHQLMASSMEVSDAVYNCRWYLTDQTLGKTLLIVQTRSQIACKLTASDFSKVDLKAFMKILSTSWSYFALLQTVYNTSPDEEI